MQELSQGGAKVVCVAFPPQGGNSWSVVNDQGAFFNRNVADEAHMYMGYFSEVYGPVRVVAFAGALAGCALVAKATDPGQWTLNAAGIVAGLVTVLWSPSAAPLVVFSLVVLALVFRPRGLLPRGWAGS